MKKLLLVLSLSILFGQDPYSFAPGQEKSPEFQAVAAWIKGFPGAPDCTDVVRLQSDPIPGKGNFITAQAICQKAGFPDLLVDAALLQRHPGVALVELKNYFKFGDPTKYENFRYVRENAPAPLPGPSPLPPQPANPIGPEFAPGKFFAVTGDTSPPGFIFSDSGRAWRKACRNQMGSAQSCWYDELKP